jgi:hypothetical protein
VSQTTALYAHLTVPERDLRYRADMTLRNLSASRRALPTFLVIGAQRSGTSSLYHWLVQHPAVLRAKRKEVHYFDFNVARGASWYRAHFPLTATVQRVEKRCGVVATGEATPNYLFDEQAPERVRALLPDVRLVAVLRNPVERALSHYRHEVNEGREQLPLEQALQRETESAAPEGSGEAWAFSYVRRGLYAEQLARWLHHFPQDQMLVVRSEDLFRAPHEVIGGVLDFIGIRASEKLVLDEAARNSTPVPEVAAPEVRAELAQLFAEPNQRLATLLGRDFGWS